MTISPPSEVGLASGSVRLNRSCRECQRRKIKCIVPATTLDPMKCMRCSKLAIDCVFLPPIIKKKRKRNESRIKQLEQRLEELQEAIAAGPGLVALSQEIRGQHDNAPLSVTSEVPKQLNLVPTTEECYPRTLASDLDYEAEHSLVFGGVDPAIEEELYSAFCTSLAPNYPLFQPPEPSFWQDVKMERPGFFMASLAAASGIIKPKLSAQLFQSASRYIAEKVVIAGHKSLDLVQTLLILSTWHPPPARFQELKFTQYAHMAATMMVDLRASNKCYDEQYLHDGLRFSIDERMEAWRTSLACYFLCSSISLSYHRPNVLRYDQWVEHCLAGLESSSSLSDRRLVELAKLQRLVEETFEALGLDNETSADISDVRANFALAACVEQVEQWRRSTAQQIMNGPMIIHCQMILIKLHEHALYDGHDLSDFRPPYIIRSHPQTKKPFAEAGWEAARSFALCVTSAHSLIHSFLNLSTDVLKSVPVIIYTRMMYATVVLIKCHVSMKMSLELMNGEVGEDLDVKGVLLRLLDKLDSVQLQQQEPIPVPAVFRSILSNVAEWCKNHLNHGLHRIEEDIIEPLIHLSINCAKTNI
ncbi:hypothetical protein GQ53DRAFT_646295 [Thozetella sp. PMI_491]|nr:hypothetical protein GQ53DRAFT_646295 [Thozetella sp. PMI_491]